MTPAVSGTTAPSESATPGLTGLAAVLDAYLSTRRRQRTDLSDLRAHAEQVDPTLRASTDARTRLRNALTTLEQHGRISLPKTAQNYDNRSQPPLPLWVTKVNTPTKPTSQLTPTVWPHALSAAGKIASRPDEHDLLRRIADWLRDRPDAQPVPLEERSLELLGDEKALGRELSNRLFTQGGLTLDLLRCFRSPLPLASQHVPGTGPTRLLILENNATWYSALTALRDLNVATRPDVHVAWGSGASCPASMSSIRLLDPQPARLFYFGDLDYAGLTIATASAREAALLDLPALEPASTLYEAVLISGTPRPDPSQRGSDLDYQPLISWLPSHLREPVWGLLATGEKVPQETVGLDLLRTQPALLSALLT